MAIKSDQVGLLVDVKVPSAGGGSPGTPVSYVIQADDSKATGAFSLGVFPKQLMVLLVAAKNKFKDSKLKDIEGAEAVLTGLVMPNGTGTNFKGHLTYSTLPFVYICDNALGKNGATVPIYELSSSGDTLSLTGGVTLDRENGNFIIETPSATRAHFTYQSAEIGKNEFLTLIEKYNGDFINSGVESGNLFRQLADAANFAKPVPFKNTVFANVLNLVAGRWFNSDGKTKDYNIGASLYLSQDKGEGSGFTGLMQSLNIKSVNKAAHAEVRIALLLDFLTSYGSAPSPQVLGPALANWQYDIDLATSALKKVVATSAGETKKLGLFSSLLPCYMCLGNIESTVGGYIKTINGQPVGLNASFDGVAQTALIVDTDYYDVDSAIEYRTIDVFKGKPGDQPDHIASIAQVNVSEPLVSNVRLTLQTDSSVTPFPMSVSNAGSGLLGVGLQNEPSMLRYTLAAAALELVHSKTAKAIVDETPEGALEASREAPGGPTPVHQY